MFYFVSDKFDRDIQEGFLRVMQKNVATKTFSTRRSSTGVDKRNGKKFCKSLRVMVICKFNKYVYEADIYNCNNISVLTQQTLGLILKAVVVI